MRFVGVHDVDVHPFVGGCCDFDFRKFSFVPKLPYLPPYPIRWGRGRVDRISLGICEKAAENGVLSTAPQGI